MKTKHLFFLLLFAVLVPWAANAQANSCVIESFPWTENFNSYGNGYFTPQNGPCWAYRDLNNHGHSFQIENGRLYLPHGNPDGLLNGAYCRLTLPQLELPSDHYAFSLDVYREAETKGQVEVFVSTNGSEFTTPIGYISTRYNYNCTNYADYHYGTVPPENGAGWYTYSFNIPYSGSCYIVLRCTSDWAGQSYSPKNLYMDNFCIREVPYDLAVSNITTSTADISWTPATDETEWRVQYGTHNAFYNGTFQEVTVTGIPSVTLTNLDPVQRYHVRVKAVYGGEKSGWSLPLSFDMASKYTIGRLSGFFRDVPFNTYNKYSYTQQIYTHNELGDAGAIRSIEFFRGEESPCNRNVDVYMTYTDKESFESTGDWISINTNQRVFSGTLNFSGDDWTVVELNTPFNYDGQHNLAIIVDDNTGVIQSDTYFEAFESDANQTLVRRSSDNINPQSPGTGYFPNIYNTTKTGKNRIRILKDYPTPNNPHCTAVTTTTATVDWNDSGTTYIWQICLNDDESNLITVTADQKPYTLTGLNPGTQYNFKVRGKHDNSELYSAWSNKAYFNTIQEPASLPYSTNFETEGGWLLVNGACTNQWCWGEAAHNGEGTHGLYISNDGGTTNAYTYEASSMVYAYKTFNFDASVYSFSYDWNANGENSWDFLRVALVPDSVSLDADISMPTDFNYYTLPEGWIALDGGSQLNLASNWNTVYKEMEITTAGHYNVVFAWRNDHSVGNNPPAAIDNVSIEALNCPMPANLTVSNVNYYTADLNWNVIKATDSYTIKYRPDGLIVPLIETFEGNLDLWTLRNCETNTGIDYSDDVDAISGVGKFRFYWTTNTPQYLISPELTSIIEGMKLEFYYKNFQPSYPESFQVGYSSTDNETTSFTFGDEIIAFDMQWHLFSESIPIGTKYFCIKCTSYDQEYLYIDDIIVSSTHPWQTAAVSSNATEVRATLTGLDDRTSYEAYVYPDCNPDKVSDMVMFSTPEAPLSYYATDFETECDWTLVNGDRTNQWCWGTAASNGEGTHGIYISNDGGTTNDYDNTSNTMVYSYKTFLFDTDIYNFSYDWNAYGENQYDFLRVALVPDSVSLEAGTSRPTGFRYYTLPEGWIALDGGSQLNLANGWNTMSQEIEIATAGHYNVVFAWRNDNSDGTNPPAAIDNVSIEVAPCPTPRNFTVSDIGSTNAVINWTGRLEVDSYTVKYRPSGIVFAEGFEGGTMPSGWTQSGLGTWNVTQGYGSYNIGTHNGTYNATINHTNREDETFLVTPMLDLSGHDSLALSFWYINSIWDNDIDQLYVYYRVNEGEWIELWSTTENHQEWTESGAIALPNPSANYQIGFKMIDKWGHGVGLDDITIGLEVPAGEWQSVTVAGGITEVSTTLTGLSPKTPYEAYVYPDCNPDKVSDTVSFTTLEQTTLTQTLNLASGVNWVSFYVETTLDDLKAALVSALNNASGIKITSQNNGYTSWNGSSWRGSLSPFDVSQMYVIEVPSACAITLEAMPIDPAEHPITIVNGTNWIGFPFSENMTLTNAFNGFAVNGDKVSSLNNGNANYQGSWSGGLSALQPGKGYKLEVTTTAPRTFTFPTGAKKAKPFNPIGK